MIEINAHMLDEHDYCRRCGLSVTSIINMRVHCYDPPAGLLVQRRLEAFSIDVGLNALVERVIKNIEDNSAA